MSQDLAELARQAWEESPAPEKTSLPQRGDVVVLRRTQDYDVEWAVLASDTEVSEEGRLLVVPADGLPWVGSADVEVPDSAASGGMVLRCRFGGWIEAAHFVDAILTASLAEEDVERARTRHAEVESGGWEGSILAREVDEDLEYQDWLRETVEPAWRTLLPTASSPKVVSPVARQEDTNPKLRRRFAMRHALALAATLVFAVGALLFYRQNQELKQLRFAEARYQQELEAFQGERRAAEQQHQRALDVVAGEREALSADAERRLAEMERALDAARQQNVLRNFTAVGLDAPRTRRGQEKPVVVAPDASHIVFFLSLEESEHERYLAEWLDPETGERLMPLIELRRERRELRLGLPVELLPTGSYLLRILAPQSGSDGVGEEIAEYRLQIQGSQIQKGAS